MDEPDLEPERELCEEAAEDKNCSLQDLPPELLNTLPLDRSSLVRMVAVSKRFRSMYTARLYWSVTFDGLPENFELLPHHQNAADEKSRRLQVTNLTIHVNCGRTSRACLKGSQSIPPARSFNKGWRSRWGPAAKQLGDSRPCKRRSEALTKLEIPHIRRFLDENTSSLFPSPASTGDLRCPNVRCMRRASMAALQREDIIHILNQPRMKSLHFLAGLSNQHTLALRRSSCWPLDAPEDPALELTTGRDFVIDNANLSFRQCSDILRRSSFTSFIWKRRAWTCLVPETDAHDQCNHITAAQIEALMQPLHRHLEMLYLSSASSSICWADGTVLGSLTGFDRLKTIVIEACLLLGHHICPRYNLLQQNGLAPAGQARHIVINPFVLGCLLPTSVERLILHVSQDEICRSSSYCQQIVRGIVNEKRRLPQLHEVVLNETSGFFYRCICGTCYPYPAWSRNWTTSLMTECKIRNMFLDCAAVQIDLVYM